MTTPLTANKSYIRLSQKAASVHLDVTFITPSVFLSFSDDSGMLSNTFSLTTDRTGNS